MSSILKALRKLEEEKAALGEGRVDLARDILKRSAPRRTESSGMLLKLTFSVLLFGALALCAWLVLRPGPPVAVVETVVPPISAAPAESAPPRTAPVIQPQVGQAVTEKVFAAEPEPAGPPPVVVAEPPQPTLAAETVAETGVVVEQLASPPLSEPTITEVPPQPLVGFGDAQPEPPAIIPAQTEAVEEGLVEISVPSAAPVVPAIPATGEGPPTASAADAPSLTTVPRLPELTVNAIAFKPLPGERLAVINDLPVMEGTSIDGVQIIEILPDGVRFSWHGTEFILPVAD